METPANQAVIVPTQQGYDLWSEIYDDEDNPLIKLEEEEVRRHLGPIAGCSIADIGCGTGRHAIAMAEAGANVTAVDFSDGMLEKAKAKPGAGGIRFIRHDIAEPLPFDTGQFEIVINCLVTDHVANLESLFTELGRICRPDGFILVSAFHPAMAMANVQARFTDPKTGIKTSLDSETHQVSDYIMAAVGAGLQIRHVSEHLVDDALIARSPRSEKYRGWPLLLMMRLHPKPVGPVSP